MAREDWTISQEGVRKEALVYSRRGNRDRNETIRFRFPQRMLFSGAGKAFTALHQYIGKALFFVGILLFQIAFMFFAANV